eukprot:GHVN01091032.1.p2 GENE.GHVN01091032.1~~GHVN01091032.1.p2  ORF type:complete len:212 (-),score=50.94 GHVN01091032.1:307-942(-)
MTDKVDIHIIPLHTYDISKDTKDKDSSYPTDYTVINPITRAKRMVKFNDYAEDVLQRLTALLPRVKFIDPKVLVKTNKESKITSVREVLNEALKKKAGGDQKRKQSENKKEKKKESEKSKRSDEKLAQSAAGKEELVVEEGGVEDQTKEQVEMKVSAVEETREPDLKELQKEVLVEKHEINDVQEEVKDMREEVKNLRRRFEMFQHGSRGH